MKSSVLIILCCCATSILFGQQSTDSIVVDHRYREDQFYFSLTYNLLVKIPNDLKQTGFSSGIHLGVIRDMPINERRNKAIGIGLGLSTNSYNQNVLISQDADGAYVYQIIDENEITIKRNKFTTYALEVPIQYRWRTSTAKDYKFWRIYTGLKLGYVFYNASKFSGSIADIKISNNNDLEKLQYGLTLSAGYSTWNFHVYYGLNSIFKDAAQLNGNPIDMNSIKVGLMFYVL